jgi:WD40 repeat protein
MRSIIHSSPSRPARFRQRVRLLCERLESRTTPSTLVYSGADRRDLVFDPTRNLLYVTTSSGTVQRYNPTNGTLLSPLTLPGSASLNGADITPDGTTLIVTDSVTGGASGDVRRINLVTGAVTTVSYPLSGTEGGSWDVVAVSNNLALFTTRFNGIGAVPIHFIDLTTNTIVGNGQVSPDTLISRSADRSRAFFTLSNMPSGPIFTYMTASNSFGPVANTDQVQNDVLSAVNRDGSLIAVEVSLGNSQLPHTSIIRSDLSGVEELAGIDGGIAFDPNRDVLYGVDSATDELVAFDTTNWREKYRLPIGEDVPASSAHGPGVMVVNSTSSAVYLSTPIGVRRIDLPPPTGVAFRLTVDGFSQFLPAGVPSPFTVTALDPDGNVAKSFSGTVFFSSTAGSASLPAPYTFTAADQGRHTFSANINTTGTFGLIAASPSLVSGVEAPILVHAPGPVPFIPIPDHRGMVYDSAHDLLYIATEHGTIERYQPTTGMALSSWKVGNNLRGIDLSPDGSTLLVADALRGATAGFIRRVDTATGAVTNLTYTRSSGEGGAWDVAIFNNGQAMFTTTWEGTGSPTQVRTINLATDTISNAGLSLTADGYSASLVARSADRSTGFLGDSGTSTGPIRTYKAMTGSFSSPINTNTNLDQRPMAVNRNGTQFALEAGPYYVALLGSNLNLLVIFSILDAGMAFDPVLDRLYTASSDGTVRVYDTTTYGQIASFPVADAPPSSLVFSGNAMMVSDDGRWLFLQSTNGIDVQRLIAPTATTLTINPSVGIVGQPITFTATVNGARPDERVGEFVQFLSGGNLLGTAPLDATGHATFTTSSLTAANYGMWASYTGDAGYAPS